MLLVPNHGGRKCRYGGIRTLPRHLEIRRLGQKRVRISRLGNSPTILARYVCITYARHLFSGPPCVACAGVWFNMWCSFVGKTCYCTTHENGLRDSWTSLAGSGSLSWFRLERLRVWRPGGQVSGSAWEQFPERTARHLWLVGGARGAIRCRSSLQSPLIQGP